MTTKDSSFINAYQLNDRGIGDINTISLGPDDPPPPGANANLRRLFWNPMFHSTTQQAGTNWLSRLGSRKKNKESILAYSAGNLNLGGHGNVGIVETGAGQSGPFDYKTNIMYGWNRYIWEPLLSILKGKPFPIIYIYSCHTGASAAGADFLYQFAQVVGKPVAGNTGLLYSDNTHIWMETGAVWQVATPDAKPNPIEPPSPPLNANGKDIFLSKKLGGRISVDLIERMEITTIRHFPEINSKKIVIDKIVQKGMISLFFGSLPMSIKAGVMAIKTGVLRITIKDKHKTIEFAIYNNRILMDSDSNYYYINPAVFSLLEAI